MLEIHRDLLWIGNAMDIRSPKELFDDEISAVVDVAYEEQPAQLPREFRLRMCTPEQIRKEIIKQIAGRGPDYRNGPSEENVIVWTVTTELRLQDEARITSELQTLVDQGFVRQLAGLYYLTHLGMERRREIGYLR